MTTKDMLKKTGRWICKNKNLLIYAGGLMGVIYGCMNMGADIGYKNGVQDGVYTTCSLAEEIQPGMRKKIHDLIVEKSCKTSNK